MSGKWRRKKLWKGEAMGEVSGGEAGKFRESRRGELCEGDV